MSLSLGLALIVLGTLVASCGKDESYPKTLKRGEFVSGKLRMFTNEGEVTDPKTIERFTESVRQFFLKDNPNVYSFDDDISVYNSYNMEIELLSNSAGRIKGEPNSKIDFTIQRKDGVAYYVLQDTINYFAQTFEERYKCTPILLEKFDPFRGYAKGLRTLYGKEINNEVHLTFISIMEKEYCNGELRGISIKSAENNMISENYLSKLRNLANGWTDTIVYKESHIVFK